MAVAVGAVVESAEPKLDRLTGLVCIWSPVTPSGITMLFAAFSSGAAICVVVVVADVVVVSAGLLMLAVPEPAPSRFLITAAAGLGLVCPVCSRPSDSDPGSATFRSCFTLHSARDRHLHPRPRPRPRPLHLASASATTHLFASDTPRPSRPP